MAELLVQEFDAEEEALYIKFTRTVKVSSIANSKFIVTGVTNPFDAINITEDYSSVSRVIKLRWGFGKFDSDTTYELTITGLEDSSGVDIADQTIFFTTPTLDIDTDDDGIDDPVDSSDGEPSSEIPDIVIEDFSIKSGELSNVSVIPGGSGFYVKSVDPTNGEYYLDTDYNNGRIAIKFSEDPQAQYLNSAYFKAQRKPIQRSPARWETLETIVSKHSNKPWVFVDFPSLDDTPVYTTLGTDYFEENYKYRIIVSSEVGSE